MKQTDLFDAPVSTGANQTPAVTTNQDDRAPFFDNADSLLQAIMVQISSESAKAHIQEKKRTIFELTEAGEYFVIKSVFEIKDDRFYGYKLF